jgi:4'-phosphopantetheinyl transferase
MSLQTSTQAPAVLHWPQDRAFVQDALQGGQTVVLCITQPQDANRPAARENVRLALKAALGAWLGCPATAVVLHSSPGTALRIQHPPSPAALSISHEEGLSLAAIAPDGAVGVDLLATTALPNLAECLRLARDYLGPSTAQALTALPAAEVTTAFALAWTQWEARLKCAGLALTEWQEIDHTARESPNLQTLALPSGYVGAIARSLNPRPLAEPPLPRSRSSA